jgi:excisionase family DNA binding protein
MNQEDLVGISEACQILGVSETSMRQWTDEGRIKAFITPGGHRRYTKGDLKKFTLTNTRLIGLKDFADRLEDTVPALRETAATFLQTMTRHNKLDPESLAYFAILGRRLLALIVTCVTEPAEMEKNLIDVRAVGSSFGKKTALLGAPLTDSVQVFVQHRDPILRAVTNLLNKHEGTKRLKDAMPIINQVLDEALVALVAAHQEYRRDTYTPER